MVNRNELKKKYGDEKVFVIPVNLVTGIPDKFTRQKHDPNIWIRYANEGKYIPRWEAEYNNAFQQIIPYFVVTNEDETKYFVAKRLKGEARLVDKLSLGFGGHINECDGHTQPIFKGLVREMGEELNILPSSKLQFCGTIRDITSETNDHFGLAFIVKANEENVSLREVDRMECVWMTKEELFENYTKFEGWSKYIIDALYDNYDRK